MFGRLFYTGQSADILMIQPEGYEQKGDEMLLQITTISLKAQASQFGVEQLLHIVLGEI